MRLFSDIKLSENIFIAVIPLFGYIAAFFYAVGKFYTLKVPLEYIQINIELILLSSFLTFSILLIVTILSTLLNKIQSPSKEKYILDGSPVTKVSFRLTIVLIFLIPIIIAVVFLFFTKLPLLFVFLISFVLLVLLAGASFIPPLLKSFPSRSYRQKFDIYYQSQYKEKIKLAKKQMKKKTGESSIFNMVGIKENNPFLNYVKLSILSILWGVVAFFMGYISVRSTVFTLTKIETKDYIVLGSYSDKFILVGIDTERKITTNEILLVSENNSISLSTEEVGIINENKPDKRNSALGIFLKEKILKHSDS